MFHKSKQVFLHSPNATKFWDFSVLLVKKFLFSHSHHLRPPLSPFCFLCQVQASDHSHTLALQHILISNAWLRVPVILSRNLKVWVVFTVWVADNTLMNGMHLISTKTMLLYSKSASTLNQSLLLICFYFLNTGRVFFLCFPFPPLFCNDSYIVC